MENVIIIAGIAVALWFLRGGTWSPLKNSEYSKLTNYWRAVSAMETAGWTSPLYKQANNMFGMKQPAKRATTSKGPFSFAGSGVKWASFYSPSDSVADQLLYLREFNYPTEFVTLRAMIDYMGSKGYYGSESSDSYYAKVLAWAKKEGIDVGSNALAA